MSSKMRPETKPGSGKPCPYGLTAWMMVREAVRGARGLSAGKLHDSHTGLSCAIGTLWDKNPNISLPTDFIDEVAMFNDTVQTKSPAVRKKRVLEFINARIKQMRT